MITTIQFKEAIGIAKKFGMNQASSDPETPENLMKRLGFEGVPKPLIDSIYTSYRAGLFARFNP